MQELKYSNTNTYLLEGSRGKLLVDTGWAGTFPAFCSTLGERKIPVQAIDYILITHYHPDHCGIAGQITALGPKIAVMDVQKDFVHAADVVFEKEKNRDFVPISEDRIRLVPLSESRSFLDELGLSGEILHTPGHSDDSVSLCLDDGRFFVGDLNPLYELPLHSGTLIEESWKLLLSRDPKIICYGHAKPAVMEKNGPETGAPKAGEPEKEKPAQQPEKAEKNSQTGDLSLLAGRIVRCINKGMSIEKIQKKTGADKTLIEDINRMYLTHPGVSLQGILDRIEIKGR